MQQVILNFHGVGPIPRPIDPGEHNCWLEQDFFNAVLDLIPGQSHVQITFDDGNVSDLEIALPALIKRGLKAAFYICSGRLDQPTFLNSSQLRQLQDHGMTIGCHGVDHLPWRELSSDKLNHEIVESKNALEKVCGCTVDRAACPFGSYNRRVLAGLHRAGYQVVYTSDGGTSSSRQWLQARTTVTRSTSLEQIQHLIHHGAGAWNQSLINARTWLKRLR